MRGLPFLLVLIIIIPSASISHYFTDSSPGENNGLSRRRWDRPMLSWRLDRRNINTADEYLMRNTLHRAFDEWQAVSAIRFTEKEDDGSPTDLVVAFEREKHDDQFPFDGKDGIVAHAFFPRDGRLHFDADEEWTLNTPNGVNLFQTAVHEVGHLLGLPHSKNPRAVMNIAKKPYDPDYRLAEDDVLAIQRLYPLPDPRQSSSSTASSVLNTFPFALPPTVRRYNRRFDFLRV